MPSFMLRLSLYFLLLAVSSLLVRCTDPTVIGGELLDGNQLPVVFSDSLPVQLTTQLGDTSQVASFQVSAGSFAVGCLQDPLLGTSRASVGFELLERDSSIQLDGLTIDSVVLVLPLDTSAQVGDPTALVSLRVLQAEAGTITLLEPLTSEPLVSTGVEYGTYAAVPPRNETTENFFGANETTVDTVAPQIRIPLNQNFIDDIRPALDQGIASDTTTAIKDSLFAELFAGLIIEASDCSANFPAVSVIDANSSRFGVRIYYNRDDSLGQYSLSFFRNGTTTFKFRPFYQHEYASTFASSLLTGAADSDSISVVQSLDGLITKVSFPDLAPLNGVAINFARLQIPIIRDGFAQPLDRLVPARRNSVGDLVPIGASSATFDAPFAAIEGGALERIAAPAGSTRDSIDVYNFNLTSYFQAIAEGTQTGDLFLLPVGQVQIGGRSLLVGPDNDEAIGARLLLATTTLP